MELRKLYKRYDNLKVVTLPNRAAIGAIAAEHVAARINELSGQKNEVNVIFASAPSQTEFLTNLKNDPTIQWSKVNAFHMDEYIGLPAGAPQLFASFLKTMLFEHVPLQSANYFNGNPPDLEAECRRYGQLIFAHPPDIVCLGIGENTHLAFNDPGVADFKDSELVKIVALDAVCRQQQVNDKCFERLEDVPTHALTLTVPVLINAPFVYAVVPTKAKAIAIKQTLTAPVSEQYPSTILRTHPNAILFLDEDSASLV